MRKFFENTGFIANIDECRKLVPSLMTFEDFLKAKGYDKSEMKKPSACSIM